ncbi:MAG: pentapeptide repeat-containing protein [Gammaproteobacteria bacterium]|nr:pentapeptide repeat-containing protein [Gammaproteobacteria bacterium]
MATKKLPLAQAATIFARIKPELGVANQKRLTQLQTLCQEAPETSQLQIATVLQHLYPNNTPTQASTNLRKFRLAFNEATAEAGVKLEWKVDQDRKRGQERACWFEGDKLRTRIARQHSRQQAYTGNEQLEVPTGISLDPRQPVRFFICYARANQTLVEQFKKALWPKLKTDINYLFKPWQDTDIILGADWHTAIQTALGQCNFGILLTSSDFFSSEYVKEKELPAFLPAFLLDSVNPQSRKPAIPVGLEQYGFNVTQMHGLKQQQIFRHNEKFFNQTTGNKKIEFAEALHLKIRQAIEHHDLPVTTAKSDDDELRAPQSTLQPNHHATKYQRQFPPDCGYPEPVRGHRATVGEAMTLDSAPDSNRKAINVLDDLHNWLNDKNSEPFYALLGDLGMGKTTTLRTLTQELLSDETAPTPLYFDLRDLHDRSANATLESILLDLLNHSWGVRAGELSPQDIIDLVQKEGAVAIFDGLDEVLVNLPPLQGQQFTRLLWQILPPRDQENPETRGRMILSCRTHYFPSVHEQNSLFLGENREQIKGRDYRGILLLPFNETQIKNYLRNNFPQNDADQSWQLIQAIHNLQDLATRPYTLSVIASQLKVLEQKQLRGEEIDATDLYEVIINDWLNRDEGKHQLSRHHKRQLMGMLAYDLWQSGQRSWPHQRLEQWLVDRLHQHPEIVRHYQLDNNDTGAAKTLIALFKEDLRTATFIVRPNDDEFRFAHSSMLEYFLACQLYDLCATDETDSSETAFALQPSQESWAFMAQIARRQGEAALQRALRQIKQCYRPGISENALRYVLLAQDKNWPSVSLTDWQLPGAKLRQFEFIAGHSTTRPTTGQSERLNLSGINLKGADLRQARFHHCRLDNSRFQNARLAQAEFLDCQADGADFSDADLTACTFRNHTGSTWQNSSFETDKLWRSHWLSEKPHQDWLDCRWPEAEWLRTAYSPVHPTKPASPARFEWLTGHSRGVTACVFSPDGQQLLSASQDTTLKLWDRNSGECINTFTGHSDWVTACAFSPDGQQLLSASRDTTLKLWNWNSGECINTFTGHLGLVTACAFSPDGQQLLSASDDNTLKLWDRNSGECINTFTGHSGWVTACAFSPDGQQLLSASDDNTLKLWDRNSKECINTFAGHSSWVTACAFSPDGQQLLSASRDTTLKLWDRNSGACINTFTGHSHGITACAFSPDGKQLLSASRDGTLRRWHCHSGQMAQPVIRPSEKAWVVIDEEQNRVISCGPEAWRYLGWVGKDENGELRRYPAEINGWLPEVPD